VRSLSVLVSLSVILLAPRALSAQELELSLPVEERTLDNGLRVLVLEDHSIPNAAVYVGWRVGSRNERPGITGLAHFFEHMMFTGGRRYGRDFDPVMEAAGGANNAYTTRDVTVYSDWCPAEALPLILDMEADRMSGLVFDPSVVESERGVVASERRSSMEDPASELSEQLWATAYTAHPYQWDVLGWMVDIESWQVEDLDEFFRTHYAPNNAVLVVVGSVDTEEVLRLIEAKMGSIARGPERRAIHTREPPQRGERRVTLQAPAGLAQILAAWHIPETRHPDFAALDVLERVLLGGDSSRLYSLLVRGQQLCLDVGGGWQGYSFDPNLFTIEMTLREGVSPAQAEAVLYRELARLAADGPTAGELQKAQTAILADLVRRLGTISSKADLLIDLELFFGGWGQLPEVARAVERVSAADVQRVLRTYLVPTNRTVATLLPTDPEPPAVDLTASPPAPPPAPTRASRQPTTSAAGGLRLPQPQRLVLDNGLRVLLVPDPEVPLVSLQVRVEGGAVEDPEGREGRTMLLARLLMDGAGARDGDTFLETVDSLGGRFETGADERWVEIEAEFLARDTELAVSLVADVLRRPRLSADDFRNEQGLMLAYVTDLRDDPGGVLSLYWRTWALAGQGPLARPSMGDEESLAAVTLAEVQARAREVLRPNRTWIAVSGDFDPQVVAALLERELGDWASDDSSPARTSTPRPPAAGSPDQVLLVDAPDALQTYFAFGAVAFDWTDPDYPARLLANTVLGGRFTSRLNTALRIESGLSYGAYSQFDDDLGGLFAASSYTATETSREALELAGATYERFRSRGITADELTSARTYVKGQFGPGTLETASQQAGLLLELESEGLDRALIDQLFARLDGVELEDVNRVIRERFPRQGLRWVVIGPADGLREVAAELGEVTEIELAQPGWGPR
jgi:zinc protease